MGPRSALLYSTIFYLPIQTPPQLPATKLTERHIVTVESLYQLLQAQLHGLSKKVSALCPLTSDDFQFIHRGTRGPASGITSSIKINSLTRKGKLFIDGEHYSLPLCIGQSLEIECGQPINVIGDLELKRSELIQRYIKTS